MFSFPSLQLLLRTRATLVDKRVKCSLQLPKLPAATLSHARHPLSPAPPALWGFRGRGLKGHCRFCSFEYGEITES